MHNDMERTYLQEVLDIEAHKGGLGNLQHCCTPAKIQYKRDCPRTESGQCGN